MTTDSVPAGALHAVNDATEGSALLRLHDSLLQGILSLTDIQSRVAASMTCRRLARVSADHPPTAVDLSSGGVHPEACRQYIERAKGAIVTLVTERHEQRTACDAASARRFRNGVRCTQVLPYTAGPSAVRLASCLPNLRHLALHEATSCLGGMTDEFAAAVAAKCPLLTSLEVAFTRYSLPSEFFTDAGMMALVAGCPRLSSLSLTNCGAITDRSLYAVAVHCRGLSSLALGGYHELITDYGTVVLFQACTSLERVVLSGKLRRVTDESAEALAVGSGASLQEVKLTRSMSDKALAAFASHCKALRLVDCCKCEPAAITPAAVAALLEALTMAAAKAQCVVTATQGPPSPPQASQPAAAAAAVVAGESTLKAAALLRAGNKDSTIRLVLPPGVPAADIVQMAPSMGAGGSTAAARWRAVVPTAPSLLQVPYRSTTGLAPRPRPLATSMPASASSTPSSSLGSSPSSTASAHIWMMGGGSASALIGSGPVGSGGAKGMGASSGHHNLKSHLLVNPAGLCGVRCPGAAEGHGGGIQEVLVHL